MGINDKQKTIDQVTDFVNARALEIVNKNRNIGTVTNIEAGLGLSINVGSITSTGTISLNAKVSDLNNTKIVNPVNNQVLSYNGTSWINQTYAGLNGANVAFTDLTDVYISGGNILTNAKNKLFYVNSSGTSLIPKLTNDFVQTITPGYAIDTIRSNETVNVEFNSSKIDITSSLLTSDYIHGHDVSQNKAVRQTFQNTPLSLFLNNQNFIPGNQFYEGEAIDITDNGTSIVIGVCTLGIGVSVGGITGILPITKGGTAGTTSASARINLELEYNVDILPVAGPSFRNNMYGNHISLLNDGFGLSLISGGTSYVNGNALILINPNDQTEITISNLTITTISGVITAPINQGVSMTNINLLDYGTSYAVYGTSGVSSYYQVTPNNINLLFGGSLGFRNNLGVLEVKTTGAGNWSSFYPLEFDNLTNVTTSSLGTSDLLIYNGTSWINTNLVGNSNYDVDLIINGTSTILQIGACPNTIDPLTIMPGTITSTEFGYLNNLTSNIQDQLNSKLGPSPNDQTPNNGDMLFNDGTCWVLLSMPTGGASGYILGVSQSYTPEFGYLYNFYGSSNSFNLSDYQNSNFINVSSGSSPGYRVTMADFLEQNLTGSSSGLDFTVDKQIKLNIPGLSTGTDFSTPSSDYIAYYNNSQNQNLKMNIDNLATQLAGNGLASNSGTLEISTLTETLKLYNYGLSGLLPAASLHTNSLAGVSDNSLSGTSLVYSNGTSWYYVSLGNYI